MTHERDVDRLLDHWFSDGPNQVPDRVMVAVVDRIGRQSQRPAWRLDRRLPAMTPFLKIGAAIAAVVLIALVGFGLLRGGGTSVGGPPASPTASPPSPSASVGAAVPRACDLLANAEVRTSLNLSSDVTSGPASGSNSEVDYCVYRAAGSEIVDLTYRNVGGGPVFDVWSQSTGVQPVSGLGDRAAWDPAQKALYILKGSRFVEVAAGGGSTPMTLEAATAIGTILVGRM